MSRGGPRKGSGHPLRAGEPTTPVQVRLTATEKATARAAAERDGVSLGEWIRRAIAAWAAQISG